MKEKIFNKIQELEKIEGEIAQLESPQLALKRIAARVKQGGHDVPQSDVLRRFQRGWLNSRCLMAK